METQVFGALLSVVSLALCGVMSHRGHPTFTVVFATVAVIMAGTLALSGLTTVNQRLFALSPIVLAIIFCSWWFVKKSPEALVLFWVATIGHAYMMKSAFMQYE